MKRIRKILKAGSTMILLAVAIRTSAFSPDPGLDIVHHSESGSPDSIVSFVLDDWKINISAWNGKADIFFKNKLIIPGTVLSFTESGLPYSSVSLVQDTIEQEIFTDPAGSGNAIRVKSHSPDHRINVIQNYYLCTGKDYVFTDFEIESAGILRTNYMAPVFSNDTVVLLPEGQNKLLTVPFDNDKWVRYQALAFGSPLESYEVTAFLNKTNRYGIVAGSVTHDTWKTGIRASSLAGNTLTQLEIYGGASSYETRDILPHGTIRAKKIKSPKIMIGVFSDWRIGLETYAGINEIYAPRLPWNSGKPFVWNSWGAIQTNITYTNATEVAEFIAGNLQNSNFQNDSTVYINLDSYWDRISYSDLIKFVKDCNDRKQKAGIYWTPFVDWAKDPNRLVEGTNGTYRYSQIYLYANGNTQEIAGGVAIDPTHPATKMRAELYLKRFIDQGFKFLKLDFMSHGALESDSHYDTTVFTGIQAYNQGMKHLTDFLNGRMYLNLSISPLFPAQYAHGRRIACDAYGSMNDTEYTLNSLTYGWWLDRVYTFNDADNVVLSGFNTGENRARVTSSVITGMFCIGDNFSNSGTATAKSRAATYLTNAEINRVARLSRSFSPVEASEGNKAGDQFVYKMGDTVYVAVFNFSISSQQKTIQFDRIGLSEENNYVAHELWTDQKTAVNGDFTVTIPMRDVRFYKIYEGIITSGKDIQDNEYGVSVYPNPCDDILNIRGLASSDLEMTIFDIEGRRVKAFSPVQNACFVGDLKSGVYLFSLHDTDGKYVYRKFVKN